MKNSNAYVLPANIRIPRAEATNRVSSAAITHYLHSVFKLAGAAAFSLVAGWSCASMVSLSMDSGYQIIARQFGEPYLNQGVITAMALWFVVLPFSSAFTFGWFKKLANGSKFWGLMPGLAVSLIPTLDFIIERDVQSLIELAPWIACGLVFAYAAYFAAQFAALACKSKSSVATYPVAFAAFLPAGYCVYNGVGLNPTVEFGMLFSALLMAAYMSTRHSRLERPSRAFLNCTLVLLPIVFPLLFNAIAHFMCFLLDSFNLGGQLGWKALASAQLMMMATVAAMVLGTAIACRRNRLLKNELSSAPLGARS